MSARLSVVSLLALVALGLSPAHAEEVVPFVDPTPPEMSVRLAHGTTWQEVCGRGRLRSTGPTTNPSWSMVTVGMRSNGQPIRDVYTFPGTAFEHCYFVDKDFAPSGNFTTVVSYTGVGGDYPSVLVGDGLWHDGQDTEWEMSQ